MDTSHFIGRIIENDVNGVREALREHPALANVRDEYLGSTPLHFAAHRGFTEIVGTLLEAGADLHALERASGSTPLHWAAEGGHPAIARMFVERGADLEVRCEWHRLTPLGWATAVTWAPPYQEDKPGTAAYLLDAGAELDVFTAIAAGRPEVVRELIAADTSRLTSRLGFMDDEMQPLHFAASRSSVEMARVLLEMGAPVQARTMLGLTPLALTAKHDDTAVASLLREFGATADVSSAYAAGDIPAMHVFLEDEPPSVAELELTGALLFAAARDGSTDAAQLLIDHGADVDIRVRWLVGEVPYDITPLSAAANNGHAGIVRALLEAGAEVNPDAGRGMPTPLHVAAGGGHVETVRALLNAGADIHAREGAFKATPLEWAENSENQEVIALLSVRAHA